MNPLARNVKAHTRLFLIYQSHKNYGTPANQMARAMKKLSVLKSGKKKGWHDTFVAAKPLPTEGTVNKREPSKQGLRRINVLNKLFMRNITDLMATGEISQELLGKGIQISQVKVAKDFNIVNVFWVASGKQANDSDIEKTLKKAAGFIKHELSDLRVMGVVPHISFVKDKKLALVQEVEELLKIAEYPEDHTPTEMAERLKDEFEVFNSLPEDVVKKIQALEACEPDEFDDIPLPEMQHNVFGLDQDNIMKKISKEKEQIRSAWEQYEVRGTSEQKDFTADQLKMQQESEDEVKERFKKFLESKEFNKKERKRANIRILDSYEDKIVHDVDESIYFNDGDYLEEDDLDKKQS